MRISVAAGHVAGVSPGGGTVATGFGAGWAYEQTSDETHVLKLDPRTGKQIGITKFDGGSGAIATGGGAVWTLDTSNHLLTRIDPETSRITGPQSGVSSGDGSTLAVGDDAAWVARAKGVVTRVGF